MPTHSPNTPPDLRRERERNYRRFYRRGGRMRSVSKTAQDPQGCIPTVPLQDLLSLDPSKGDNLATLSKGLRFHIAAKTLQANEAAQIMRFAEFEASRAPKVKDSATDALVAKVLSQAPPPPQD